jgi:hypothetical protein
MIAALFGVLFASAWAAEVELSAAHTARVEDLLENTVDLTRNERSIYLLALVDAGLGPGAVHDALERALEATEDGASYDEALEAALDGDYEDDDDEDDDEAIRVTEPVTHLSVDERGLTAEQLAAVRAYRLRHLAVRTEVEYTGGTATVSHSPYGWGYGGAVIDRDPLQLHRSWAIYQGPMRLEVPTWLSLSGDEAGRSELEGRIERKRWLSRTYYGLAGVGVLGIAAAYIGGSSDAEWAQGYEWGAIGAVGLGFAVGGLVGGSIPAASATRLRTDFTKTVDIVDAQKAVDARNEALRAELGLTPEQALAVESEAQRQSTRFMIP